MITQMKKYSFLIFHGEYEAFLTQLREAGVLHVTEKAAGFTDSEVLNQALQLSHDLSLTIDATEAYLPQGGQLIAADNQLDAEELMTQFHALVEDENKAKALIADTERVAKAMQPWGAYSLDKIEALAKAGYVLQCWSCNKANYSAEWGGQVVAEEASTIYFVTLGHEAVALDADEVHLAPHCYQQLQQDIEAQHALLAAATAKVQGWVLANKLSLEAALKACEQHIDWQKVVLSTDSHAEGALMLLEGFCPVDKAEALNQVLDAAKVYYQTEDPAVEDATPIQLKNNKFAKIFEVLTGMYGWPNYGEFDPTPILAPFYLLFFAMCMGDAGYGIILTIFGLLTCYKKVNIAMFEGLGPIITVLGLGTTVVGFILGTFMGLPLADQAWYPDALKSLIIQGKVAGFDAQMVLALGVGVFHICLAMTVKAICYTKRFGFRENLSTWGWLLLIVGGILTAAAAMLFNLPGSVTKIIIIAVAAVSALGIYIFNKPGRNPLINIGAGLYDTYNMATGLLGDVLSYIRLYALGLAGGMLGNAFNMIGGMVLGDGEGSIVSVVFKGLGFLLIVLFGHTLNLLMSALGAFVHPLRLTFVEYFKNAGYEGSGALYKPFK